ncbi:adenosine deaminase [Kibdelosporangium phytohabitans]|uniref:Adenosine deaminase n=1 Tax=Kibdelosporangium phytohabitans TaxID=860235 RepID=A0A0N9I0G3_9PSEU|nr:adenosine deaminase [Kibdelosporangium phytohabitans]ALG07936.1 adenosine deaminase [Kibdelosporangium phytohabitans]MBE1471124.1 aminodeoxyfutalosine deaminase [Kibdelosporangium phytohabitans]
MKDFVSALPKAELHVHLVGSASIPTVLELARRHPDGGVPVEEQALKDFYEFRDFAHFIDIYIKVNALVRTGADVLALLLGLARDQARDNVRYSEVTVTPTSHLAMGIEPDELTDTLDEARRQARAQYGVEFGWIFDIDGVLGKDGGPQTLDWVLKHRPEGTVALGLGGPEVGVPREWFREQFAVAADNGLRCVPHAGETTGPATIWAAINELHAERIGHGTSAARDPRLVSYLADNQIPLEVNPTSNIRTKAVDAIENHPLPELVAAGVPVAIGTDDPGMFHTTLNQEYLLCHEVFGYDRDQLADLASTAVRVSYAPDEVKSAILEEISAVNRS